MSRHDHERRAAAYVSGVMDARERSRFDRHLLTCERCWREVGLDRQGRDLAEAARQASPAHLRATVRAAVTAAATSDGSDEGRAIHGRPRDRLVGRSLAAAAALIVLIGVGSFARTPTEPASIAAALHAYEAAEVEAHHEPMPMPDLGTVGLQEVGATHMDLADVSVDAFAYRTDAGSRLTLFVSGEPFPPAGGAEASGAGWHAASDGIRLMAVDGPTSYLVLTSDGALLGSLRSALDSGRIQIA